MFILGVVVWKRVRGVVTDFKPEVFCFVFFFF